MACSCSTTPCSCEGSDGILIEGDLYEGDVTPKNLRVRFTNDPCAEEPLDFTLVTSVDIRARLCPSPDWVDWPAIIVTSKTTAEVFVGQHDFVDGDLYTAGDYLLEVTLNFGLIARRMPPMHLIVKPYA